MNHIGDANKKVSETPRMDASAYDDGAIWETGCDIERELNAANDRIKRLEEDSERLNWLLDRGLAWRDCYDDFWKEGEWLYASQSALETIDKSKEAKL